MFMSMKSVSNDQLRSRCSWKLFCQSLKLYHQVSYFVCCFCWYHVQMFQSDPPPPLPLYKIFIFKSFIFASMFESDFPLFFVYDLKFIWYRTFFVLDEGAARIALFRWKLFRPVRSLPKSYSMVRTDTQTATLLLYRILCWWCTRCW